jgi:ribosomal protein S18 acetylase RimI-like enzyme
VSRRKIILLDPEHPLRDAVVRELEGYGLGPAFLASPPGLLLAAADGGDLEGFGVFHDLRDPAQHPGTAFDMEAAAELLARPDVGLFRIALLHSCTGPDRLAAQTERLLGSIERLLAERYTSSVLVIPLFEEANARAFPLYEKLGFKQRGLVSHALEIDLEPLALPAPPVDLPAELAVVFMDGLRRYPVRGLARCYARIFLEASQVTAAERVIGSVLDAEGFAPELSFLVRRRRSGRVVGFLLSEHVGRPAAVNITVVGLDRRYRDLGVPFHSFPLFAARCVARGVTTATEMTSRRSVVRLICDLRLVWLIRAR